MPAAGATQAIQAMTRSVEQSRYRGMFLLKTTAQLYLFIGIFENKISSELHFQLYNGYIIQVSDIFKGNVGY
jgi:hypothetical protein